jgi:hypothetical protein
VESMRWVVGLILFLLPAGAAGDPGPPAIDLTYDGYASGFRVLMMQSEMLLTPTGYRIAMTGRTTGMVGFVYQAKWRSWADGTWSEKGVNALNFDNTGVFGGQARHIAIAFDHGNAQLRALQPIDDGEHTAVPPAQEYRVIDGLSVTALIIHQAARLGRCQGRVRSFDGRTIEALTLEMIGTETLPATARSTWSGPTLRCQIDAHVLAGFYHDERSDPLRIHSETMWLANVLANAPPLPVRMTASSYYLGHIMLYLTRVELRDSVR